MSVICQANCSVRQISQSQRLQACAECRVNHVIHRVLLSQLPEFVGVERRSLVASVRPHLHRKQ